MTDFVEAKLLERISELTRFIAWVEAATIPQTIATKTQGELLSHLRRELATEQRNLRRLQWERGVTCPDCGGDYFEKETILSNGELGCSCQKTRKPWPWGSGE